MCVGVCVCACVCLCDTTCVAQAYKTRVTSTADRSNTWTMLRRYTDFFELDKMVRRRCRRRHCDRRGDRRRRPSQLQDSPYRDIVSTCRLPAKKWFGSLDDDVVHARQVELHNYLRALIRRVPPMECSYLNAFLEISVAVRLRQRQRACVYRCAAVRQCVLVCWLCVYVRVCSVYSVSVCVPTRHARGFQRNKRGVPLDATIALATADAVPNLLTLAQAAARFPVYRIGHEHLLAASR